jgi:hypothetical protein
VQGAHDGELQNDGVSRIENEIFSFSKYYHWHNLSVLASKSFGNQSQIQSMTAYPERARNRPWAISL